MTRTALIGICRINGLGYLARSTDFDEGPYSERKMLHYDWQGLAFGCEAHARTCTHPACGASRLEKNGTYAYRVQSVECA